MGTWTVIGLRAAGGAAVALTLADVFFTVLFPAGGHGPVRRPLSRETWQAFAVLGRRLRAPIRRRFLAYSGPVQITTTILTWTTLLVVGWAMVFRPALGHGIEAAHGSTDTGFATALYYSGFALTTLGTGDVVPTTDSYRLLTVVEAALGFSVFTLAEFLTHTSETHRSSPVLRYFHFREDRYALPRVHVAPDLDAGVRKYIALGAHREATLRALSAAMLYDWEEIDVRQR